VKPGEPLRVARAAVPWFACAAVLAALPLVFGSNSALSLLTQLCALAVFTLSYNMLLGQTGMLSFGHAVYTGLGGYFTAHTLNAIERGDFWLPVSLVPLAGGLFAMMFGAALGFVNTRKAGTAFAMISLGIVELVSSATHVLPAFFGKEGGINTNRTVGGAWLGISLGPQIQLYGLVVVWTLASALAMYGLSRTPLGRIANAVRDNAERVEFIGYDAARVRWIVFVQSTFFAGISGALMALNFENVGAESVGVLASGQALVFAYIGGIGSFAGPVVGAVLGGLLSIKLSDYTKAWSLYLGVFFVLTVVFAPGGVAGLIAAQRGRVATVPWSRVAGWALVALAAIIATELGYGHVFAGGDSPGVRLLVQLAGSVRTAAFAAVAIACGGVAILAAAHRRDSRLRSRSRRLSSAAPAGDAQEHAA
jgi:branched-chain amino acid transport system permease protein